jgi:ABC-type cobalamin transport system permease subunit
MKSLIIIPLIVFAAMAIAVIMLSTAGLRFKLADPVLAGGVAATAGIVGFLPILRARHKDAVSVVQLALIGTILHLLCSVALGIALIASHTVDIHGRFIYWFLGAYWASLVALVGQLRRSILALTAATKVQK